MVPLAALVMTLSAALLPQPARAADRSDQCQHITSALCEDAQLGYNLTRLPNGLGHETQEAAKLELNQFYPLVKVQCSASLRPFLCLLYLPECEDRSAAVKSPCRELCLQARQGCETLLIKFGAVWPAPLDCANFPSAAAGQACAAPASSAIIGLAEPPAAGQDSPQSTGQDSQQTTGQDNSPTAGQDSSQTTGQDSPLRTGQDSGLAAGQDSPQTTEDSSQSTGQDNSPTAGQDSSQTTGQDSPPSTGQDSGLAAGQDSPQTTEDSSQSTGQDNSPAAGQDRSPTTGQNSSQTAGQDSFSMAGQDSCRCWNIPPGGAPDAAALEELLERLLREWRPLQQLREETLRMQLENIQLEKVKLSLEIQLLQRRLEGA